MSEVTKIYANSAIPYALINEEVVNVYDVNKRMKSILEYYKIYKDGADFTVEGNGGDYVSAQLRYKLGKTVIDKQARFMFANTPDFNIKCKGSIEELTEAQKESIDSLQEFINSVLDINEVGSELLKGAKDCLIGGSIAIAINYLESGIDLIFLDSTKFIYELGGLSGNSLTKFIAFVVQVDSTQLSNKRILKKKYELIEGKCVITDSLHDGTGKVLEEEEVFKTELESIPCVVINNNLLLGDNSGESEISAQSGYESYYSKLSNADIDSGRKNMNPIRYTVDMDTVSTADLSSSAGAYWDLASDQNNTAAKPMVGILKGGMDYSDALTTTLERIRQQAYEEADIPNITAETLSGTITSGKGLKALYWGLMVRCDEKWKIWKPKLEQLIKYIIDGALLYSESALNHTDGKPLEQVEYIVEVVNKYPIPEDETEEKGIDLQEVNTQTMSRKSYMKKWRNMTDKEADDELKQIALEREMLEESYTGLTGLEEEQEDEEIELDELGN